LQKEFRKNLGVTFAFLGDEIYIKAGLPIPSRKHYGNYPQIEDGVGMIRSFNNSFEKLLKKLERRNRLDLAVATNRICVENVRTHQFAIKPRDNDFKSELSDFQSLNGTFLTGEMFAPVLREQIEKLNRLLGSQFYVLAVPNLYFGGDVSVAGLLTGQDFLAVKDKIKGDFVVIPKQTIKSDEPILLDGMTFDDLKSRFNVPIHALDAQELIEQILAGDFQN
jgi:NifB/MoaA-like Fe-S oxidoreductase